MGANEYWTGEGTLAHLPMPLLAAVPGRFSEGVTAHLPCFSGRQGRATGWPVRICTMPRPISVRLNDAVQLTLEEAARDRGIGLSICIYRIAAMVKMFVSIRPKLISSRVLG